MAQAIWEWTENGQAVVIYNQGPHRYSKELWERLKLANGLTDAQLAKNLNNK